MTTSVEDEEGQRQAAVLVELAQRLEARLERIAAAGKAVPAKAAGTGVVGLGFEEGSL